jgi:Rad3-related DNA helicase
MENARFIILTSTRGLQSQLMKDFGQHYEDWTDVRGQSNYLCVLEEPNRVPVSEGPCHAGLQCEYRSAGCTYYDAKRKAANARVVVTNYAFWLSENQYGEGIGTFDVMICDEAHNAPDEVASWLSVYVSQWEVQNMLNGYAPDADNWQSWAARGRTNVEQEIDLHKRVTTLHSHGAPFDHKLVGRVRQLRDLARRLARLSLLQDNKSWVFERTRKGWRWDPIWPAPFAERYLYRNTPKVIFVSASIREKTMELMGVKKGEYGFHEYPSTFPKSRRPVYVYRSTPPLRWTHKSPPEVVKAILRLSDRVLDKRHDRKGIIHSVSYDRKNLVLGNSTHRTRYIHHKDSTSAAEAIRLYREHQEPKVLLSPSVTTGLDFPYTECEFQIIPKVPFPDSRSAILRARAKADKEYPMYLAAQETMQATGRGMRAEDDQCETFILDESFFWFVRRYKKFFSRAFLEAIVYVRSIPKALPKLKRSTRVQDDSKPRTRS